MAEFERTRTREREAPTQNNYEIAIQTQRERAEPQREIALVAIVQFSGDKLIHEHIYWDQASVLVQIGLSAMTCLFALSAEIMICPRRPK